MTSGMLQDTMQASSPAPGPRFRPYASPKHQVTKGRYITSNDPRGYIPVYEYPLNGQWIMMDIDDGYILWTGIWKALGNSKADIVKMIDSQPDLAPLIRRVRGGYLKIQGTWMPYEVALKLSRRVAWTIRDDLVPLFGPTFPSTCLSPDQPGYGQVVASGPNRRRLRRNTQNIPSIPNAPREPHANWTVVTPNSAVNTHQSVSQQPLYSPSASMQSPLTQHPHHPHHPHQQHSSHHQQYDPRYAPEHHHYQQPSQQQQVSHGYSGYGYPASTPKTHVHSQPMSPISPRTPPEHSPVLPSASVVGSSREPQPQLQRGASGASASVRYSPYSSHANIGNRRSSLGSVVPTSSGMVGASSASTRTVQALDTLPMSMRDYSASRRASIAGPFGPQGGAHQQQQYQQPPARPSSSLLERTFALPPVRPHLHASTSQTSFALPPISTLEDLRGGYTDDSAAVLRRLKEGDDSFGIRGGGPGQEDAYSESDHASDNGDDGHEDTSNTYASAWEKRGSTSVQPGYKLANNEPTAHWSQPPTYTSNYHHQQRREGSRHLYREYRERSMSPLSSSEGHGYVRRHPSPSDRSLLSSNTSHHDDDGNSTSEFSPTSPATPRSSADHNHTGYHQPLSLAPLSVAAVKEEEKNNLYLQSGLSSSVPTSTYAKRSPSAGTSAAAHRLRAVASMGEMEVEEDSKSSSLPRRPW